MVFSIGLFLVVAVVLMGLLIGLPFVLLEIGLRLFKASPSITSRIKRMMGATLGLAYVALIAAYLSWVGPWQSGVVTRGFSPEGREYCIVQTFKALIGEPYQVSFYIRDTNGLWRSHYLAHEDPSWSGATVDFRGGSANVFLDGTRKATIPIPTGTVDLATIQPGYKSEYAARELTVDDIATQHAARFSRH